MTAPTELPGTGKKPIRTCVGCKVRAAKSSLLRLVAAGDGIVPDPQARQPGRGAYVHPSLAVSNWRCGAGCSHALCALRVRLTPPRWFRTFPRLRPGHSMADGNGTGRSMATGSTLDMTENLYGKQVEKL